MLLQKYEHVSDKAMPSFQKTISVFSFRLIIDCQRLMVFLRDSGWKWLPGRLFRNAWFLSFFIFLYPAGRRTLFSVGAGCVRVA